MKLFQKAKGAVMRAMFRKAPANSVKLKDFVNSLDLGMKIDEMPQFIELPNGRVLDVTNPADAATLKTMLRGGNRKQRRAKEKHG